MRILFLSKTMPPDFGAVGDYTYRLAAAMQHLGVETCVLCQRIENREQNNISHTSELLEMDLKWNITSVSKIYKEVVRFKPDVFFIQLTPYSFSKIGIPFWITLLCVLLKIKGIRVAIMFHETVVRLRSFKIANIKNNIISLLQTFHIRVLALFVTAFTSNRDYAKSLGERNVKAIVPVGSNISSENKLFDRSIDGHKTAVAGHSIIISTFGSNLRNTLELFENAHLFKDIDKYYFQVIGKINKKDQERLVRIQQKGIVKINVTGFLSEEEVYKALSISDVFIMLFPKIDGTCSGINTKSGSLAAAFACGLPVVSQHGYLTDELFESGKNCFLLQGEDMQSYIKQIEALLGDKDALSKISKQSHQFYLENLTWEVIARQFLSNLNQ